MPDINGIPYVESTDLVSAYPAASQALAQEVSDQLASKLDLAGGKILQIVRATDTTDRSTTSTSVVDAGISVTITPQKSDSAIIVIWTASAEHTNSLAYSRYQITDSSNNVLAGTENFFVGSSTTNNVGVLFTAIGYSTPATTSATTYKGRFYVNASGINTIYNSVSTGQMYAIEVSA